MAVSLSVLKSLIRVILLGGFGILSAVQMRITGLLMISWKSCLLFFVVKHHRIIILWRIPRKTLLHIWPLPYVSYFALWLPVNNISAISSIRPSESNEDPSLFLWELRQILDKADRDLSDDVKDALLSRQFMKGLSLDPRIPYPLFGKGAGHRWSFPSHFIRPLDFFNALRCPLLSS